MGNSQFERAQSGLLYVYAGMRALTLQDALSRIPLNPLRIDRNNFGVIGASMGGQFTLAKMAFGTGFVPRLEHFPRDNFRYPHRRSRVTEERLGGRRPRGSPSPTPLALETSR
jgi:hypothetical protein